jgi:hypothetical protein
MKQPIRIWHSLATLAVCATLCVPGCGKKADAEAAAGKAGQAAAKAAGGAAGEAAAKAAEPAANAPSTAGANGPQRVFFVTPKDGAEISGPLDTDGKVQVTMKFGVEGMVVKPAGTKAPNSGHHHVIIDGAPIPPNQPVPMDDSHIHFGKGQLEAGIALSPGKHKLTMQFADYSHMSYGVLMAATIEIMVVASIPAAPQALGAGGAAAPASGRTASDQAKENAAADPAAEDKAANEAAKAAGAPVPVAGAAATGGAVAPAANAAGK